MSLPDPAITNINAVCHRTQLLDDCSWNPFVGVTIVADHHRGFDEEVTKLDVLVVVSLLVGLLGIDYSFGVRLQQVECGP